MLMDCEELPLYLQEALGLAMMPLDTKTDCTLPAWARNAAALRLQEAAAGVWSRNGVAGAQESGPGLRRCVVFVAGCSPAKDAPRPCSPRFVSVQLRAQETVSRVPLHSACMAIDQPKVDPVAALEQQPPSHQAGEQLGLCLPSPPQADLPLPIAPSIIRMPDARQQQLCHATEVTFEQATGSAADLFPPADPAQPLSPCCSVATTSHCPPLWPWPSTTATAKPSHQTAASPAPSNLIHGLEWEADTVPVPHAPALNAAAVAARGVAAGAGAQSTDSMACGLAQASRPVEEGGSASSPGWRVDATAAAAAAALAPGPDAVGVGLHQALWQERQPPYSSSASPTLQPGYRELDPTLAGSEQAREGPAELCSGRPCARPLVRPGAGLCRAVEGGSWSDVELPLPPSGMTPAGSAGEEQCLAPVGVPLGPTSPHQAAAEQVQLAGALRQGGASVEQQQEQQAVVQCADPLPGAPLGGQSAAEAAEASDVAPLPVSAEAGSCPGGGVLFSQSLGPDTMQGAAASSSSSKIKGLGHEVLRPAGSTATSPPRQHNSSSKGGASSRSSREGDKGGREQGAQPKASRSHSRPSDPASSLQPMLEQAAKAGQGREEVPISKPNHKSSRHPLAVAVAVAEDSNDGYDDDDDDAAPRCRPSSSRSPRPASAFELDVKPRGRQQQGGGGGHRSSQGRRRGEQQQEGGRGEHRSPSPPDHQVPLAQATRAAGRGTYPDPVELDNASSGQLPGTEQYSAHQSQPQQELPPPPPLPLPRPPSQDQLASRYDTHSHHHKSHPHSARHQGWSRPAGSAGCGEGVVGRGGGPPPLHPLSLSGSDAGGFKPLPSRKRGRAPRRYSPSPPPRGPQPYPSPAYDYPPGGQGAPLYASAVSGAEGDRYPASLGHPVHRGHFLEPRRPHHFPPPGRGQPLGHGEGDLPPPLRPLPLQQLAVQYEMHLGEVLARAGRAGISLQQLRVRLRGGGGRLQMRGQGGGGRGQGRAGQRIEQGRVAVLQPLGQGWWLGESGAGVVQCPIPAPLLGPVSPQQWLAARPHLVVVRGSMLYSPGGPPLSLGPQGMPGGSAGGWPGPGWRQDMPDGGFPMHPQHGGPRGLLGEGRSSVPATQLRAMIRDYELELCRFLHCQPSPLPLSELRSACPMPPLVMDACQGVLHFFASRTSFIHMDPTSRTLQLKPGWWEAVGVPPPDEVCGVRHRADIGAWCEVGLGTTGFADRASSYGNRPSHRPRGDSCSSHSRADEQHSQVQGGNRSPMPRGDAGCYGGSQHFERRSRGDRGDRGCARRYREVTRSRCDRGRSLPGSSTDLLSQGDHALGLRREAGRPGRSGHSQSSSCKHSMRSNSSRSSSSSSSSEDDSSSKGRTRQRRAAGVVRAVSRAPATPVSSSTRSRT
ncbi:hypothetical protein QJQ45_021291, partial [Haematococcus lacustris]